MTDSAAMRSPASRARNEKRDAKDPVKRRAGAVPSPKEAMIIAPEITSAVMAALTIIAQENMQGRKPAANPSIHLEESCLE